MKPGRLDLEAILGSLLELQERFPEINRRLERQREPLTRRIVDNMMEAYSFLDYLVDSGAPVFSKRGSDLMLALNFRVLGGAGYAEVARSGYGAGAAERFEGTRHHPLHWYERHHGDSVWKRAAGVYISVLSQPQVFPEGNHRTGALLASYVLVREGKPPFVLTVENALEYFNPSSVIKYSDKRWALYTYTDDLGHLNGLKRRFGEFLRKNARDEERYLR